MSNLKPLYLNDNNCLILNVGRYKACVDLSSLIQETALNLNSPITGYTVGANSILADTDTILQAFGKVQGQLNAKLSTAGDAYLANTQTWTGVNTFSNNITLGGQYSVISTGGLRIQRTGAAEDTEIRNLAGYNDRLYGKTIFTMGGTYPISSLTLYSNGDIKVNGLEALKSTGNILINSTVDSGEALQVTGTSKFTNSINLTAGRFLVGGNDLILPTGGSTYIYGIGVAFGDSQSGANYYGNFTSSGLTIGKGLTAITTSSILDIVSTTKGALLPRMTTAQKNAIASPAEGLEVYDLDLHKKCIYTGSAWETITSA